MTPRISLVLCVSFLLFANKLQAQDAPIGALPTRYNGGFAGEAGELRVASFSYLEYSWHNYTIPSWPDHTTNSGTFISVDHFLKKLGSGVAITAGQEGNGHTYRGTSTSLAISPKISLNGKYTIAPFADFSFSRKNYIVSEEVQDTLNLPANCNLNDFRIKTGLLANSSKAYAGISAEILQNSNALIINRTYNRFLSNMKYTLQAGYTFQRTPESKTSFTTQLAVSYGKFGGEDYPIQKIYKWENLNLLDLNLMFRYKKFISGINSTGFVLGCQSSKFKLQISNFYTKRVQFGERVTIYSYLEKKDVNTNSTTKTYTGSISLRYIFRKNPSVNTPGF